MLINNQRVCYAILIGFSILFYWLIVIVFGTYIYCKLNDCKSEGKPYVYECDVEYPDLIKCETYEYFDIRQEFERISRTQRNDSKTFTDFHLFYAPINSLPKNVFTNITFKQISIHETKQLSYIHKNAFSGPTNEVITKLDISGTNRLTNNPPNFDLYYAINTLKNLKTLTISLETYSTHEIPENAFYGPQSQNYLEFIQFKGDFRIKKINKNAFYGLPDIQIAISFSFIPIAYISSGAFDLKTPSGEVMNIHLQNCSLTEWSFGDNIFNGSKRPLFINLRENQIHYMNEETFRPIFESKLRFTIDFESNPFNCDNYYNYEWLLKRKSQLKDRIRNAFCANGLSIWDLTEPNFAFKLNICLEIFIIGFIITYIL